MKIFDNSIKVKIYEQLVEWGMSEPMAEAVDGIIILLYLFLLILAINILLRWVVMRGLHWLVQRTHATWDDVFFDEKVMQRLTGIATPVVVKLMLPLVEAGMEITQPWMLAVLYKGVDILIVLACLRFVNRLLKTSYNLLVSRPSWHGKPIKGLLETGQVLIALVGIILIVAILVDKSPVGLLAGLGASAAVISFIFKDSLMGLIAGVQLSLNNMLKEGDWIEMPSRGIDGMVVDVTLTTIKIRGWNNTLQTIPPYLLVSEPFDNWQAMRDAGGRRIKRSLNIDMTTLDFLSDELLGRLSENSVTKELVEGLDTTLPEGGRITNLEFYMRAIKRYIDEHPRVNHKMISMVRQLQPTEWGLPVELYLFTAAVDWVPHEHLQTEIISYVIALAPYFDLRLYQAPSSADFKRV